MKIKSVLLIFQTLDMQFPIVGVEKGFFEEKIGEQTKIETRVFDSGPQVIESLFANSVDVAYVGPGPAINGFLNSENNNVKILAGAASGGAVLLFIQTLRLIQFQTLQEKKLQLHKLETHKMYHCEIIFLKMD